MANDSFTQQALASDLNFRERVKASISSVAWEVLEEATNTPSHSARATYAHQVLQNVESASFQITPWLVMRPNLFLFTTSYDFARRAVVTAAGDADIKAQMATDWNHLAGIN